MPPLSSCQIFIERKTTVKIGFSPARTPEIKKGKWNTLSFTYNLYVVIGSSTICTAMYSGGI